MLHSWIYSYVDGSLEGVKQGLGIDITDFGNMYNTSKSACILVRNSSYNKAFDSGYFRLEIPWQNVVEVQHFKVDKKKKKKEENKSLLKSGLKLLAFAGLVAISGGAVLILGAGKALLASGALLIIDNVAKKAKKEDCFMISYLEEDDPENLKVIVVEHGKFLLKQATEFFNEVIIAKCNQTPKADFVEAFVKKLEIEAEKLEAEGKLEGVTS